MNIVQIDKRNHTRNKRSSIRNRMRGLHSVSSVIIGFQDIGYIAFACPGC